jgi:hypothetical protein
MKSHFPHLAIIGTGDLASAVARVFSAGSDPFEITVIGRNQSAIEAIVQSGRARSFVLGGASPFRGIPLPDMASALSEYVGCNEFDAILICCSLQSPWEIASGDNAWGRLVHEAGFGVTLPLQFAIAARIARAAAAASDTPLIINAAYPDAVNAALRALQLPIVCGLGNVAILHALGGNPAARITAHHRHLADLAQSGYAGWLFSADSSYPDRVVSGLRALSGSKLNEVTAACAARLITDLVYKRESVQHVPGPLGLIGGYPTRVKDGTVTLEFAPFDEAQAIAANRRASLDEGVLVEGGSVIFSEGTCSVMRRVDAMFPDRISVNDLDALALLMLDLRNRL